MGIPVIVTRVGLMPEVVHDGVNGVFTDGTPGDLRKKIEHLLHHESVRQEIGMEAQKILEKFERVHLIKEYAEFLKVVAGSHRG